MILTLAATYLTIGASVIAFFVGVYYKWLRQHSKYLWLLGIIWLVVLCGGILMVSSVPELDETFHDVPQESELSDGNT